MPITALPGGATAFVGALNGKTPNGNTPTSAALQGAINSAKAFATANPGHTAIAILATDGLPTECDTNIANIKAIAAAGLAGTPSVKTYVIGVFAASEATVAKQNLDQNRPGWRHTAAADRHRERGRRRRVRSGHERDPWHRLPCEFVLPVPRRHARLREGPNVQYTASAGGAQVFPYGTNAAGCDAVKVAGITTPIRRPAASPRRSPSAQLCAPS